jgi:hypothetical protein
LDLHCKNVTPPVYAVLTWLRRSVRYETDKTLQ